MYKEPVFIVGVPRSGTTLLQSLLCNTDHYFPVPETHFFSRAALGLPGKNLSHENKKEILRILHKKARIRIAIQSLCKLKSKKEIFEYIINIYNRDNRDTFLEKTPRHALFYLEIKQCYPDARFICMTRDPRNTISSILKMGKANAVRIGYDVNYNLIKVCHGILQDALIALSSINFKKIIKRNLYY
jgi:hypothetical protein